MIFFFFFFFFFLRMTGASGPGTVGASKRRPVGREVELEGAASVGDVVSGDAEELESDGIFASAPVASVESGAERMASSAGELGSGADSVGGAVAAAASSPGGS